MDGKSRERKERSMSVRFAAVSNHTEEHIRVYEKNKKKNTKKIEERGRTTNKVGGELEKVKKIITHQLGQW